MARIRESSLISDIVTSSRQINHDSMATAEVCRPVLRFALKQYGCIVANVWSVDPRQRNLILVASEQLGNKEISPIDVLPFSGCLTGDVVETKRITLFQLDERRSDNRAFKDVGLRDAYGLNQMLSVPVLNTMNPHQVLCVINFLATNFKESAPSEWQQRRLKTIQRVIGASIESNLRERSFRASTSLAQYLAEKEEDMYRLTTEAAAELLAECCETVFCASRVAVYIVDPVHATLRLRCLRSNGNSKLAAEDRVPRMVQETVNTNREMLVPEFGDKFSWEDFFETQVSGFEQQTCMLIPLQDLQGKCQGMVACSRPSKGYSEARYSYDDIAIIEAMTQTFVAPLESVLESDRRRFAQQKLSHELRVPVAAFSAMLSKMRTECREQDFRFKHPHFNEGRIYVDLMKRLLSDVDIDRFGPKNVPLKIVATHIEKNVVIPALRFTIPTLRERGLFASQFSCFGFDDFPELLVDPALITQVIFNLLDNAIKYFDRSPRDFRCKIIGSRTPSHFEITVSDNGPGLKEGELDLIFKYGKRGSNRRKNAYGEGLGLWISQEVMYRHGGGVFVRSLRTPTEFVIQLPLSVERKNAQFRFPGGIQIQGL